MFFNYVFVYLLISACLLIEKYDLNEEDINGVIN